MIGALIGRLAEAVSKNAGLVIVSVLVIAGVIACVYFAEKYFAAKNGREKRYEMSKIRYMTTIALLSAISTVLMLFEFPLPIAPGFYKIDLSELPIIVGAFALGPMAGVIMEVIKIVLNLFINGTLTAFVGELANLIIGASFIIPASIIYYAKKTKKRAGFGLLFATVFTTLTGTFLNAFVLLPFYAAAFGGMENIIAAGTAVNSHINSVFTFCLIAVAPFNLIKFGLVSVITLAIYHSVSPIIKHRN